MKRTIFYSWQSDLPNSDNRNLIEKSIDQAVKALANDLGPLSIELAIDRDTKEVPGTPDIVESIFRKIDKCHVFVADVSIINSQEDGKPSPNPNVLLELGYAARSLGWERIVIVYNLDYGSIDDLPFDLRHRRPLTYSSQNSSKADVRRKISGALVQNVQQLHNSGHLFDVVSDYLKVQVDTEVLTVTNHLHKMLMGYKRGRTLKDLTSLFDLDEKELHQLMEQDFIGFQIHKRWHVNVSKLRRIADDSVSSTHYGKEIAAAIIELVNWVEAFENLTKESQAHEAAFLPLGGEADEYIAVRGTDINPRNTEFPDRFLLLHQTSSGNRVTDFGDFVETNRIKTLTHYFRIKSDAADHYVGVIQKFITIASRWLELTNGEFIVDESTFRLSK